ncbi:hypothetical protein A0H81_06489 [Grifola frondosa]|uniref:Fungal-type protein kinase domain-containing protein n=1 Tax=Grifola frondosa TaxID=5627 RepID=A0A1C7MFF9_GRIFR|nr:hypothetical protein A0H81_06489 [Grifola frondosa]
MADVSGLRNDYHLDSCRTLRAGVAEWTLGGDRASQAVIFLLFVTFEFGERTKAEVLSEFEEFIRGNHDRDRELEVLFVEVPNDEFPEYFSGGSEPPATKNFKFKANLESEDDMYLEMAMQSLQDSMPDQAEFVVKDTARWHAMAGSTHATAKNDKQPDLGIYPGHEAALNAVEVPLTEDQKDKLDQRTDTAPFSYATRRLVPGNDEARKSRGQLADYAKEILARQHRQFLFMIVVVRDRARILGWDRAGAAVSRSFNYVQHPEKLGGFIYRYATMTPVERGFDPTATLATMEEVAVLKAYIVSLKDRDVSDYLRECMNNIVDEDSKNAKDNKKDAGSWPIYKIELDASKFVPVKRGESEPENNNQVREDALAANVGPQLEAKRYLLVGRAMSTSLSPTGRGTKGFAAYDMTEKTHVFLKDTWRPDSARIHAEGDIYKKLIEHGVRNIATLLYCGDVGVGQPQTTCTQHLLEEVDTDVRILPRIHYRLVFEEIARPLRKYQNSFEMARAVYAALTAHRQAWENAGILHRDISDGNIMICDDAKDKHGQRTPTAFLNDWDLAKYKHELAKPPTQKTRSGTWQFISAALLRFPQKQHEVSDDIESFIHVVNWLSFWYHKNNYSDYPERLGNMLDDIYNQCTHTADGYETGGDWKSDIWNFCNLLALLAQQHYKTLSISQWSTVRIQADTRSTFQSEKTGDKDPFLKFRLRPIDRSQADTTSMPPTPPAPTTQNGVLSNHSAIIAAFRNALPNKWNPVDKVENIAAVSDNNGNLILRTITGANKRSAENASSEDSESDERPSKRQRS